MNWLKHSLAQQLYALVVLVMTAGIASFAVNYRVLGRISGDVRFIDVAARQNTLTETVALYAGMVGAGQREDRGRLRELLDRFDRGQALLRRGGELNGLSVPPAPQQMVPALDAVDRRWSRVRPDLSAMAAAATSDAAAARLYAGARRGLSELSRETQAVDDGFQRADQLVRRNMGRAVAALSAIRLLVVIGLLWAVRRRVLAPIAALESGIARFRAGDRATHVEPAAKDELGAVTRSFNEMVAEVHRLTTAVEQTDYGIVITDPAGTIQYVNSGFERLTGYSRVEALGQNPRLLKSGRQPPEVYADLWATIAKGDSWQGRIINKRKDGTLYTSDHTITPVRGPSGTVVNFIAVQRDVTALLNMEEQLRQMQKMEAIGRLAGGIAHDLNNILTVITGSCELIKDELADPKAVAADLEEIRKASKSAANLVQRLLAFGRRQPAPQVQVLEIADLLDGMRGLMRPILFETIELEIRPGPRPSRVKADRGQLEQVILNLAYNARDAMPSGGRFTVEASREDSWAVLAFTDTGTGMSPQAKEHLFEPFFTTKEKGRGTGMGLASAYGVIKQHGGTITVASEPGEGTTVTLRLPTVCEQPAAAKPAAAPARGGKETVLLVEDEAAIRTVAQRILSGAGYTVIRAAGLPEAVEELRRQDGRIDILVTDVILRGHTGVDVALRIGALCPRAKVLYMSGYTSDVMRDHGLPESEIRLLQKPFSSETLLAAVRAALDS